MVKKQKVITQIMEHLQTGKLYQSPEITPVIQMDSPVKQYLINNPIDNPDENEPLPPLMPSS